MQSWRSNAWGWVVSDQLAEHLSKASQHIDAGFDVHNVERGLALLERRIARRRRVVQGVFASSALLAACALVWVWRGERGAPLTAAAPTLSTRDGSFATLRDQQTELSVTRDVPAEVALELRRGRAHFEVTRNPARKYRVHAGPVEVEVLGTAFDVEILPRHAGEELNQPQVLVAVDHGIVRVQWDSGSALLRAGDSGRFPQLSAANLSAPASSPPPAADARAPEASPPAWRSLARAGKHQEAFRSLGKQPVEDLPGLLLAADAARLSGHLHEAARYLEHLVQRYPQSPSAPIAAFTLGRLNLYELEQPALAARSFGRAYALDPNGAMAEDALAREAEAYHQAGDAQRSKKAAERYLERYPNGERRAELARYLRP